tara:strand:- start:680 stop:1345 length:666 start_codon:yes stop_codon:yes gene_type:complete
MIAKEAFELGFIPVIGSFAKALKEEAAERGCSKEENPEGYRKFCQTLGAEKRLEDPMYWVNKFNEGLDKLEKKEQRDLKNKEKYWERCVIVDDCRYANELKYAREKKATTVFIMYGERDNPNKTKGWTNHESEEMANTVANSPDQFNNVFEYFLYNDADIKSLEEKVKIATPFWCKIQADENAPERMKEISRCISNLIDLLLLSSLEEEEKKGNNFKEGAD